MKNNEKTDKTKYPDSSGKEDSRLRQRSSPGNQNSPEQTNSSQRKWKNESKKKPKTGSTGKSYVFVSYMFLFLFVAMIAYMIYFQVNESEELLSSPYNSRQSVNQASVVRGSILSSDGTKLAYTQTDEEGNETRIYAYDNLFAQTVGYSDYGSAGLEATQNYVLLNSNENLIDRLNKDLTDQKKNGDNLVTTLDIAMQSAAYDALGSQKGAVVVLDADTAKVMASVSKPDFNPNTVYEDWEILNLEDSGSPFLNRGLQGLYEPGSTFKIVTALAYLEQYGTDSGFSFNCTGEYTQGGYTIHCSGNAAHGSQTLEEAFANSCNCAFSYIATELLESGALFSAAKSLHFNEDFSLVLPSSESSYTLESTSAEGLTMQTAIGQGNTVVTPIHMAMIAQSIYNKGEMLLPSFLDRVTAADSSVVSTQKTQSLGTVMSTLQSRYLKSYMRSVVEYGTASSLSDLPYNICGKTGTSEYSNDSGFVHSWFVGFTDMGNDDVVIVVILEEAVPGESTAAKTAGTILQNYFG